MGDLCTSTLDDAQIERAAAFFRAAGDPARLRILTLLTVEESCVGSLCDCTGDGMSTVSQRLRQLHEVGLVRRRKVGRHVFYALADAHVEALLQAALEHAAEHP